MQRIEEKLKKIGVEIPIPPTPQGNYVSAVSYNNLIFLSGTGPLKKDGSYVTGKVGSKINTEEAYQAARITGLNILANLKMHIGDLNRVKKIIKVLGMVNSDLDFIDHPKVINGFSDLMVEIFGDSGRGARSAVGVASLPMDITVEIEAIFEIK